MFLFVFVVLFKLEFMLLFLNVNLLVVVLSELVLFGGGLGYFRIISFIVRVQIIISCIDFILRGSDVCEYING